MSQPIKPLLSVVVPVYNEEVVLPETFKRLKTVLDAMEIVYEVILVNDGSKDKTAEIAADICAKEPAWKFLNFSRNFGHQIAITAGMDYSSGDAIVVIDADLQDPPELIPQMMLKWHEGFDVVYAKRVKRDGETFFKKFSAKMFYKLMRFMTDFDLPTDVGDYRLIDVKVKEALKLVNERNRYIRGIISWLGFKQTAVEFNREKRFAGETKYPLRKMIKFAFDGITSFSYKPLKIATYIGSFVSLVSFIFIIVVVIMAFLQMTVTGWASTLAISLFFNGVVLVMLGIIGEYIGRIFDEVKARPLYIVARTINLENESLNARSK
ncbi:MAG: glycosyltransferase family 2 protein [Clostridia bacterium]